jgi:hypothetical protein
MTRERRGEERREERGEGRKSDRYLIETFDILISPLFGQPDSGLGSVSGITWGASCSIAEKDSILSTATI